jgi:hypothetical protein
MFCRAAAAALAVAFVLFVLVVALAAAVLCEGGGLGPIRGGATAGGARRREGARARPYRQFPAGVRLAARAHPEWGAVDYDLFEVAPGDVSAYSSMMPWHAPDLGKALRAELPDPPRTITDATAHVGGDSAFFLKVFPSAAVTAVEVRPAVAAVLRRNARRITRALSLPPSRLRVVVADARDFLARGGGVSELVFFDPPWAGSRGVPLLGDTPLAGHVAAALRSGARAVLVKLPREVDLDAFEAEVGLEATRHPIRDARVNKSGKLSYWLLAFREGRARALGE